MDGSIALGRRLGIPYLQGGGEATKYLLYHRVGGRSQCPHCPLFQGTGVPRRLPRALGADSRVLTTTVSFAAPCEYEGKQFSLGESWLSTNCLLCTCLHPIGVGCCET